MATSVACVGRAWGYAESGLGGRRGPSGMNPVGKVDVAMATCCAPVQGTAGRARQGGISAPAQKLEQAPHAGCLAGGLLSSGVLALSAA